MATRLNRSFKNYQQKRAFALFLIAIFSISIAVLAFISFYLYPNHQGLQSILLLALVVFLTFILLIRQYMMTVSMYLHYYRMIEEKNPSFKGKFPPYSEGFTNALLEQGFLVGVKKNSYTIFYKLFDKLPFIQRTGPTFVVFIQTFLPGLTVHHEGIEQELSYLKSTLKSKKPIQNELTIILKKMDNLDTTSQDELEQIINFSLMNRAFITLQLAEFANQTMYMLRPKKLYPNKYYYALVQLVYDLIKIEEN
jgi:hypothetical protein